MYGLHTRCLLARLKCLTGKIHEIKIEKIPTPCNCHPISILPNATRNGCELSWQCSIFERSIASSPRASDRISFSGSLSFPPLRSWARAFASRLAATESARGLALMGIICTNIYLGYEIHFGSPGEGLCTRSSWVRVRATIRLPRVS